jgi:hypothetical protein
MRLRISDQLREIVQSILGVGRTLLIQVRGAARVEAVGFGGGRWEPWLFAIS